MACCAISPNTPAWKVELVAISNLAAHDSVDYPFGGISGLDYRKDANAFLAITDDRAEWGPARFYQFALNSDFEINNLEEFFLTDIEGKNFNPKEVDAESIRYHPPSQIVWSSELSSNGPQIYLTDINTHTTSTFALPEYITGKQHGREWGARPNKFVEGITFSTDFQYVTFAMEAPLQQDDEIADIDSGAHNRLLVYEVATRQLVAEYIYKLDAIPQAAALEPKLQDNGISEILAYDNDTLLVLERSGRHIGNFDFAYDNRIYSVEIDNATNVIGIESIRDQIDNGIKVVEKELLVSVGDIVSDQENFESMSFGPAIDGKPSLYLVSDNNFHKNHATQLLIFTLQKD